MSNTKTLFGPVRCFICAFQKLRFSYFTAVAFDAHVLKWSLDDNPPDEYARHHIKEASIYGHNVWSADFTVKIPEGSDGKIKFNYAGINEKAMWPAKKASKEEGGRGMRLFEQIDNWLQNEKGGIYDATLVGCVGGVAWV